MNTFDKVRHASLHFGRERFSSHEILNARIIVPEVHHLFFPRYLTDQIFLPGVGSFVLDKFNFSRHFEPSSTYRRWLSHAPASLAGANYGASDWLYPDEDYYYSEDGFHWVRGCGSMLDGLPCIAADFAYRMGYVGLRHPKL